jgi:hypothetical protein
MSKGGSFDRLRNTMPPMLLLEVDVVALVMAVVTLVVAMVAGRTTTIQAPVAIFSASYLARKGMLSKSASNASIGTSPVKKRQ